MHQLQSDCLAPMKGRIFRRVASGFRTRIAIGARSLRRLWLFTLPATRNRVGKESQYMPPSGSKSAFVASGNGQRCRHNSERNTERVSHNAEASIEQRRRQPDTHIQKKGESQQHDRVSSATESFSCSKIVELFCSALFWKGFRYDFGTVKNCSQSSGNVQREIIVYAH